MMNTKIFILPMALLVLGAGLHAHAADKNYQKQVVNMACGEANESSTKLTPDEVNAIERNFKDVPSIMPE